MIRADGSGAAATVIGVLVLVPTAVVILLAGLVGMAAVLFAATVTGKLAGLTAVAAGVWGLWWMSTRFF